MQAGERVRVRAYKADGTCYRRWYATVEAVEADRVVTVSPAGHRLEGVDGVWRCEHVIRTFYWLDRWYSLLEVSAPDGRLEEIYVNVGSPVTIEDSEIRFTDYELDVSREPPHEPVILDEDEFLEAARRYGYAEPFRRACYRVAEEALEVAKDWEAGGMPAVGYGGTGDDEDVPLGRS